MARKEKLLGAIESIRDVTPKKQAERNLKSTAIHLEELVEERTEEFEQDK